MFSLQLLTDANHARCLDGTPGAYYFRPGLGDGARSWYIHYEGGGWCTTTTECLDRSYSVLGSSKTYPERMVPYEDRGYFNTSIAYFSNDARINPLMHSWNQVFLRYCDGASFSGSNYKSITAVGGKPQLYFRGSAIQNAAISHLTKAHALADATEVVVGGASAGGLAVYLHADRWRTALPKARVSALPDSGFFLAVDGDPPPPTPDHIPARSTHFAAPTPSASIAAALAQRPLSALSLTPGRYAASMREMVTMANSTAGLNPRCVAAHGEDCIFAEVSARFLRTPAFALQSAFDTWQVMNEMATGKNTSRASVNAYGARLRSALHATLLASLDVRHGAFIDSCSHHCFKWGDIRIRGAVQAAAHAQWYDAVVARGRAPRDDDDDDRVWEQGDGYPCDACCHGGGAAGEHAVFV